MTAAVLSAAAVLLAFGCGEGDDGSSSGSSAASTELTVTLDVDGEGKEPPTSEDVSCGDDSDSAECRALESLTAADFAPVKPTQACTEIFGGPDVATVEGTLNGDDVDATFTRANGCEIDRYGAILPLLQALFPDYEPGGALEP
jgi:hypothetical protein